MSLVDRLLSGDRRALARLATLVENADDVGEAALRRLYPQTGSAHIVGITGPPGAGKSTFINALVGVLRAGGRRVGVVAVDPSSPLSGGATLGDRIRMMERHADDGVFIRSMAARGHAGGLALATAGVVHLLDAAGFDMVLVETIGVGQDEFAVAGHCHTVVLLQVPGLGDGVQALKAGLLEMADILVVNKADRDGAAETVQTLRDMVSLGSWESAAWRAEVVATSAATGEGVDALLERIDAHRETLRETGAWVDRQRAMAAAEVSSRLHAELDRRFRGNDFEGAALRREIEEVADRRKPPAEAVANLLARLNAP